MDNVKGPTTAFTTFSPYRSLGNRLGSFGSLGFGIFVTRPVRQKKFLHTAQFTVIAPRHLRRAGLHGAALKHGGLLFQSAFNGDAEKYFRGFSDELGQVMDNVWRYCSHWTSARPYQELESFIDRYRRRSASFFNAYPQSCSRLRASLLLRRQIDKLVVLAADRSVSDAAFQAAFMHMSQLHWGNARPSRKDV